MVRRPTHVPSAASTPSHARFAHPAFRPAAPPPAVAETNWHKEQLGPIPPVVGNGTMDLGQIIGNDAVAEIQQLGEIRFHAVGDTGVGHAENAEQVAEDMATDYRQEAGALNPAFLFHLGDVVYGPDKDVHYAERFYRPYRHYLGKIFAIPGNHDGEVKSPTDDPSLKAFLANFCAKTAALPPQAANTGIFREAMTQPGAYWLLEAPFVRIIGLYSNCLENPGFLEGNGGADRSQLNWLKTSLTSIATKPNKALIIATHHPPFSQGGQGSHSGSTGMSRSIDEICSGAGVVPDAFLSGHAHNYQRYTRRIGGKHVPYIVAGTGGIGIQGVTPATGQPAEGSNDTTYDASLSSLGYLFVTASARHLQFDFWRLGDQHTAPFDPIRIDLGTHVLTRG